VLDNELLCDDLQSKLYFVWWINKYHS
jgi:hypothetical protein